ncbi:MAG: MinD/ParA family protein [Myxococcota bacterium]
MPRDLSDVFHYFLPELADETEADTAPSRLKPQSPQAAPPQPLPSAKTERRAETPETPPPAAPVTSSEPGTLPLPILGLPIGDRDVVRAALAWNLAIETARLGGASIILSPESDAGSPLWPAPGTGPLGTELHFSSARSIEELVHEASLLSTARAQIPQRGGIVFVRIPPAWLEKQDGLERGAMDAIRWMLLLSSANQGDLDEAADLAARMLRANPSAEIGLTIHGVQAIDEARQAFEYLSRVSEEKLALVLISYGLLVDDLHVYRAIAAQRPIGLAHPQAPATRALMDVARLLYEDARSRVLG